MALKHALGIFSYPPAESSSSDLWSCAKRVNEVKRRLDTAKFKGWTLFSSTLFDFSIRKSIDQAPPPTASYMIRPNDQIQTDVTFVLHSISNIK